jgi:hypothetical protein
MAGLFSVKQPKKPSAEEIERERRRVLAETQSGPQGGTLISAKGISAPILGTATALGGAL